MVCGVCNDGIDKELLPLIVELNRVGLITKFCCTGHDEKFAHIAFTKEAVRGICVGGSSFWEESHHGGVTLNWDFNYRKKLPLCCSACGAIFDKKTGKPKYNMEKLTG